jgi:hypothetical protein
MKRLLIAGLCAAALTLTAHHSIFASPALKLSCALPNQHNIVLCELRGQGFRARERVHISYRVTFLALPPVHGRRPTKVYRRITGTNQYGSFVRPPLGFGITPGHESYRLTARVVGMAGDWASTTFTAIAQ